MAAAQRERLSQDLAELGRETSDLLSALNTSRRTMAGEQSRQLAAYREELQQGMTEMQRTTTALLEEISASRQVLTVEQRIWLHEHTQELCQRIAAFLDQVESNRRTVAADEQQQRVAAFQEVAAEQRERLAAERLRLAAKVAEARVELRTSQNELRADLLDARRLWASLGRVARGSIATGVPEPASAPVAESVQTEGPADEGVTAVAPAAEAPEPQAPPDEEPSVVADDLTAIRGIGPIMQEQLYAVGISTFAQLARETPDTLLQLLDTTVRPAYLEDWIEQARRMSASD